MNLIEIPGWCYHCQECPLFNTMAKWAELHTKETNHAIFSTFRNSCSIHKALLQGKPISLPEPPKYPTFPCSVCFIDVTGEATNPAGTHKHYNPKNDTWEVVTF